MKKLSLILAIIMIFLSLNACAKTKKPQTDSAHNDTSEELYSGEVDFTGVAPTYTNAIPIYTDKQTTSDIVYVNRAVTYPVELRERYMKLEDADLDYLYDYEKKGIYDPFSTPEMHISYDEISYLGEIERCFGDLDNYTGYNTTMYGYIYLLDDYNCAIRVRGRSIEEYNQLDWHDEIEHEGEGLYYQERKLNIYSGRMERYKEYYQTYTVDATASEGVFNKVYEYKTKITYHDIGCECGWGCEGYREQTYGYVSRIEWSVYDETLGYCLTYTLSMPVIELYVNLYGFNNEELNKFLYQDTIAEAMHKLTQSHWQGAYTRMVEAGKIQPA